MDKVSGNLTVFFEGQFWVGVFECVEQGRLSVCKVTFGAEPKDNDIYAFILKNYCKLRFSPSVAAAAEGKKINPKRLKREISRQLQSNGIGTKSQQALKLQYEQLKAERKEAGKQFKQAEKIRKYELKQLRKKEKHRGR